MLRLTCLLSLLLTVLGGVDAQNVQWASTVIGRSSEYSSKQYSAAQALGKPNVFPSPRESPAAWSPLKSKNTSPEFIHVGFAKPMQIQQVVVAESFGPGAIAAIFLYDPQGKAHQVYENPDPSVAKETARMFAVKMPLTSYLVASVKVELHTEKMNGWSHIDAIGISDDKAPIVALINLLPGTPTLGQPENLGSAVNSEYDEIIPVIAGNGSILYFDRKDDPDNSKGPLQNDDIYASKLDGQGQWGPAENVGPPMNNAGHNFLSATSFDGKTALIGNVYLPDGKMQSGLSMAHWIDGQWTTPKTLQVQNYFNLNKFGEFTMTADAHAIVMTIQREDTYGTKDLYVSLGDSIHGYSEPLNLGADVNSAATEMSPFIAADGKTLYFATDGRSGYGNKDIFMSRRLDDTWQHWTEPANLGPVINTEQWDAYLAIPAAGDFIYFCSDKNTIGKTDIFRLPLPKVLQPESLPMLEITAKDAATGKAIRCLLRIQPMQDQTVYTGRENVVEVDGHASTMILPGQSYQLQVEAAGYVTQTRLLDLRKPGTQSPMHMDFELLQQ